MFQVIENLEKEKKEKQKGKKNNIECFNFRAYGRLVSIAFFFFQYKSCRNSLPLLQLATQADAWSCFCWVENVFFLAAAKPFFSQAFNSSVVGSNPALAAALSPWTRLFTPTVPRRSLHISFY